MQVGLGGEGHLQPTVLRATTTRAQISIGVDGQGPAVTQVDQVGALYDALASVTKALGNGRRAEIVDVPAQGERRVEDLAREIGATTSQHLQVLLRASLVTTRREGTRACYSLASDKVAAL